MDSLHNIITEKAGLEERYYKEFVHRLKNKRLQKKQYLIETGDTCSFIGFVTDGVLRSYISRAGEEFNVEFYLPGSFVTAYTSFLSQSPTNGSIQALTNATYSYISLTDYNELLSGSDAWYRLGKYISDQLFIRKCQRQTSLLTDSASERYELFLKAYPHIEQLVPQYHIASFLGIKPESLSRIKSLNIHQ